MVIRFNTGICLASLVVIAVSNAAQSASRSGIATGPGSLELKIRNVKKTSKCDLLTELHKG